MNIFTTNPKFGKDYHNLVKHRDTKIITNKKYNQEPNTGKALYMYVQVRISKDLTT